MNGEFPQVLTIPTDSPFRNNLDPRRTQPAVQTAVRPIYRQQQRPDRSRSSLRWPEFNRDAFVWQTGIPDTIILLSMKPTKEQFFNAVTEIESFSPAPAILASAMRILNNPHSDIQSIAALVGRDSALTADIIRCANSAYYGGLISRSISEAVQKIGMSETLRLLNLAVARVVSSRDLGCYAIQGANYWAESLFNGLFMQALSKLTGEGDPDEAYTAGLLRYIGRLAIDHAIENLQGALFWDGKSPLAQWELDNVGLVQAQAGGMLLRKWRVSDSMVNQLRGLRTRSEKMSENVFCPASGRIRQSV